MAKCTELLPGSIQATARPTQSVMKSFLHRGKDVKGREWKKMVLSQMVSTALQQILFWRFCMEKGLEPRPRHHYILHQLDIIAPMNVWKCCKSCDVTRNLREEIQKTIFVTCECMAASSVNSV